MKRSKLVLLLFVMGMLMASCGAIPTLPSLDSTVIIKTPQFTAAPELSGDQGQMLPQESPEITAESPSAPPEAIAVLPQPTASDNLPTETPPAAEASEQAEAPESTPTAASYPYTLQAMNPHYLGNFAHPELGCDWLGIGGQIFDKTGLVQKLVIIKVGGDLNGSPVVEEMTMPLADPVVDIAYGPGGFEVTLANAPVESDSSAWIQLFSLEGTPLSDKIDLVTYDDCAKNLLLMNFIEQ